MSEGAFPGPTGRESGAGGGAAVKQMRVHISHGAVGCDESRRPGRSDGKSYDRKSGVFPQFRPLLYVHLRSSDPFLFPIEDIVFLLISLQATLFCSVVPLR